MPKPLTPAQEAFCRLVRNGSICDVLNIIGRNHPTAKWFRKQLDSHLIVLGGIRNDERLAQILLWEHEQSATQPLFPEARDG